MTLGSGYLITVSANTLTIGGNISGAAYSFFESGSGTLVLNGAVSTLGAILENGILTLNGANNFTGSVAVEAGTLDINNSSALGTAQLQIFGGSIDNTSGSSITLLLIYARWDSIYLYPAALR